VAEAEFGERVLGAGTLMPRDRQVEVLVGACLLGDERINSPAAVEPDVDAGGVEASSTWMTSAGFITNPG
jgi:hypothetical protein